MREEIEKYQALLPALLLLACGGTDTIEHNSNPSAPDAGGAGGNPIENPAGACPHIDLGSQVPVTWTGSTAGLPNHVESSRLEWKEGAR